MNDAVRQAYTEAINPITGEHLGRSVLHTREGIFSRIRRAREAQKQWAEWPLKKRVAKLRAVRNHLVAQADTLAETIARDNGKTRIDAYATEVLPATIALAYYCKHAKRFLKDKKLRSGCLALSNKRSKIHRVAFGVVGIISPWNYPFSIAFSEVVMALLAGNAVILKTASETQMVGLALKESIDAASLPEGVFSYVNVPGRIAGDAFLEGGVDKLFLTGSVPVGKLIMAKAAETLTPVCLELGGNDAMLVCDDADLDRAAAGAVWAGFQNAGQSCGGVERIYVHAKVYDAFLAVLKQKTEALRVGYDTNFDVDMGAMTTQKQADLVNAHVEEALAKGAKIFAQSKVPQDPELNQLLPAMVLTDVDHDMDVMRHETFGPVMGVMKVKDMDEAITLANDSYLGLTGSVWSRNRKRAEGIGKRIRAGAITINDHLMSHGLPETSWGGFKESGIGRSHGELGFNEMTQPQMIVHDILPLAKKNMWWHPFDRKTYDGLKGVGDMLYGRGLAARIGSFRRMMGIVPRMFRK